VFVYYVSQPDKISVLGFTEADEHYIKYPSPLPDVIVAQIQEDVKYGRYLGSAISRSSGNFNTLRFVGNGTTYPVWSFPLIANQVPGAYIAYKHPDMFFGLRAYQESDEANRRLGIAVRTTELGVAGTYVDGCYLHMFTHEPSHATPLHVIDQHPAQVVNDVYKGLYSTAGVTLPRYSSAALQTIIDAADRPTVTFRITEPEYLEEGLSRRIYQPFGIMPTVDSSGRIVHKSFWNPYSTSQVTFAFTESNLAEAPSWGNVGRERVTELDYTFGWFNTPVTQLNQIFVGTLLLGGLYGVTKQEVLARGGDGLRVDRITGSLKSSRVGALGERPLNVTFPDFAPNVDPDRFWGNTIYGIRDQIWNRYEGGPVLGSFSALSSADSVEVGDFATITLGVYPTPSSAGSPRGDKRVVQILGRTMTPAGPTFDYIDAGRDAQPLAAPTVLLTSSPLAAPSNKHELLANISQVAAGGRFELQFGSGAALPSSGAAAWKPYGVVLNTSSQIVTLTGLPSNTTYWARARNTMSGKIASPWDTTGSKATPAITAPTGLAVSSNAGNEVKVGWTPGDGKNYPAALYLDASTDNIAVASKWTEANKRMDFSPGSTLDQKYRFEALSLDTTHACAVRHYDPFGGVSLLTSGTNAILFETSNVGVTLQPLRGIDTQWGG
jgi:hypothetical protein